MKKLMRNILSFLVTSTTLVVSQAVLAQQPTSSTAQWGVGLAAIAQKQGYAGLDTQQKIVPSFFYRSKKLSFAGTRLSYTLYDVKDIKWTLNGQVRFAGYDRDDSDMFAGMENRSMSLDLGFALNHTNDYGEFSMDFLADGLNKHQGQQLTLGYAKSFVVERTKVSPYISLIYATDDLINYYYGVRSSEATNARSAYQADATTNYKLGIRYNQLFNRRYALLVNASYTGFGSEIKNSPLIDKNGELGLLIVINYLF